MRDACHDNQMANNSAGFLSVTSRQANVATSPHLDTVTSRQANVSPPALLDSVTARREAAVADYHHPRWSDPATDWSAWKFGKGHARRRAFNNVCRELRCMCAKCGRNLTHGPLVVMGRSFLAYCVECGKEKHSASWSSHGTLRYGHQYFSARELQPCECCGRMVMYVCVSQPLGRFHVCAPWCREAMNRDARRVHLGPRECPVCRATFQPQRATATYCGATCRQRAQRARAAT